MTKLSPAFLLLALLAITGCDDTSGPAASSGGTVTASVGGTPYASTAANATFANGVLNITAHRTEYNVEDCGIDLNVNKVSGPGTFELGALSGNSGHYHDGVTGVDFYTSLLSVTDVAGSVVVTRLDAKSVAGTFQFTAYVNAGGAPEGSVRVGEGRFDVEITR